MERQLSNVRPKRAPYHLTEKRKAQIKMLLIVLPFMIFVFIFSYLPLFGWSYAFMDYKPGVPFFKQEFVGLKYFRLMFSRVGYFPIALRNTLVLSGLGIIFSPVPMIFAIMLSRVSNNRISKTIQSVASFPNFISWVIVYSLFFALFNTNDGAVNNILLNLGFIDQPTNILANEKLAWYFQVAVDMWKGTGWNAIIYIAAMSGIDQELYDAADIDGAGSFQKTLYITVPELTPTYFVLLLLSISNMLSNGFEHYWVFQNPLVMDKLEVLDTYVYKVGIFNLQYSFSIAMGIFKSIISIFLLTFANMFSKKIRGSSIF